MKIRKVEITNFRGYKSKTEIDFNDFTVLLVKMMLVNQLFYKL